MADPELLVMRGVTKRFPGVLALDGVDFAVRAGEVHALLGHNGAGKSTLIKVLTGACARDAGTIALLGREPAIRSPHEAQRAGIATIYQEVHLIPDMTAPENVFLGREPTGAFGRIDWRAMRTRARTLVDGLGVRVPLDVPVMTLSIALQQMVALARAVSLQSRLVIMDEPTSSLDTVEVAILFDVIRRLPGDGVGVVYVSHRLDEIFALADRATILRNGRRVATLDIDDVDELRLVSLMLGKEPADVRSAGVTAFSEAGRDEGEPVVLDVDALSRGTMPDRVSLQIRRGEIVGLAGLLGSGRTEFARALFGADPADGGTVRVAGRPCRIRAPRDAVRAGLGFVSEDRKIDGILPSLSVHDNILLAALPLFARLGVLDGKRQREMVAEMIDRLDIRTPSATTAVKNLSGGNQQKVLLARWLCRRPKLLILDEPTRGIDVGAKAEIQRLIDDLARARGTSILMISSELEEVIEGSDRIAVMKDGRKLGEFSHAEATEDRVMRAISEG